MSKNASRTLVLPAVVALSMAAAGFSVMTQTESAQADASTSRALHAPAVVVPDGMAWIQGSLTDQAGHRLDNVNVEVWPADPAATEPIASNLTYAGTPVDGRHDHGVFRVEVPVNQPYRIVFSAVGGAEDGDAFRMQEYGAGRPIVVRPDAGTREVADQQRVAGRVRSLGTVQLVHQGRVDSKVQAKAAKIHPGQRGRLKVRITSPFVRDVTGKVVVRINGKRVKDHMGAQDHGTMTTQLPRLHRKGTYKVTVRYLGSKTVKHATGKPTKLKVVEKKKGGKK